MNPSEVLARPPTLPQKRSPLAHLLHALNQPLTGLQCSLELASTGPRSAEQYQSTLEEALDLIARMRVLVEAVRELADLRDKSAAARQDFSLDALLRETLEGLRPVAGARSVAIKLVGGGSVTVKADLGLPGRLFRLLDSALSLAQRQSLMEIALTERRDGICLTLSWTPGRVPEHSPFSRPELGLLIAQAEWEQADAEWSQLRRQGREVCTVRLSRADHARAEHVSGDQGEIGECK